MGQKGQKEEKIGGQRDWATGWLCFGMELRFHLGGRRLHESLARDPGPSAALARPSPDPLPTPHFPFCYSTHPLHHPLLHLLLHLLHHLLHPTSTHIHPRLSTSHSHAALPGTPITRHPAMAHSRSRSTYSCKRHKQGTSIAGCCSILIDKDT